MNLVLRWVVLIPSVAFAAENPLDPAAAKPDAKEDVLWYDAASLPIEGKGWSDTKALFDRLPERAERKVRAAVWGLSRHAAGMCVRFTTDAATIRARWTLTSPRLDMPHMPATGVSGLDLYVRDEEGRWRWLANGRPTAQSNSVTLVSGILQGERLYQLYLPLYNGVSSVEIGIPRDAGIAPAAQRPAGRRRPLVFYGTSITQGGCASRPGMVHTAIIGRRLDRPVINLGFSGNGRMETEVVELMAELDAAAFILDCLPNITAQDVTARTEACLAILRKAHPKTPILLVEDRSYSDAFLVAAKRQRNETSRAALRKVYEKLKPDDPNLHYLEGDKLLGDDNEGTVDSSHPTDLGFMRQAEAFLEVLRPMLAVPSAGTR